MGQHELIPDVVTLCLYDLPEENLEELHGDLHDALTKLHDGPSPLAHAAQHDSEEDGEHDDAQHVGLTRAAFGGHQLELHLYKRDS